jgi:molybdopterin converting factor small subunit
MPVQVTYHAGGRRGVQKVSVALPQSPDPVTVRDFLTYLAKNGKGELAEIEPRMNRDDSERTVLVVLNGRNIQSLQGLDTPVHDGDSLSVLPVVAGG